jgi:ParB-like chromosome segregation protein Spo0J
MAQKIINVKPESVTVPKEAYPRRRMPAETDVQHLRGLNGEWHTKVVTANGGKILVDGAHRLLAAQLDGLKTIEVLDIGKATPDEVLKQACERNSTHGKQLTLAEKQDMAVKLVGDMTAAKLCALLGVSDRTMSRWLADAKDVRKQNAIAKARKLLDEGKSMTAIAKELGVSRSTLQGWLKADDEAPAEDPTPDAPASTGGKKKQTKPSTSSSTSSQPEVETIAREQLLEETLAEVDGVALSFITNCKDAVKGDNPDGLHWSDFAKVAIEEVMRNFPKAATRNAA